MTDTKLPPLPPRVPVDKHLPTGVVIYGYTNDMMCDYARDYARAKVAAKDAQIEALRAEVEESDAVVDKLARLLAETAIVIKGPEPDMTKWSYHDIPDGVRAIQARAEQLAEALRGIRRDALDGCSAMDCARDAFDVLNELGLLREQEEGR